MCGRLWLRDAEVCQGPGHLRRDSSTSQQVALLHNLLWRFPISPEASGGWGDCWQQTESLPPERGGRLSRAVAPPVTASREPFPPVWLSRVGCPDVPQAWS